MMAGVKLLHVPYRGESLAMTDLIGGQVQIVFATIGSSMQYVKSGSVRALAVTAGIHRCAAGRAAARAVSTGLRGQWLERAHRAEEHAAADRRRSSIRR